MDVRSFRTVRRSKWRQIHCLGLLATLALTGCAVTPEVMTAPAQEARAAGLLARATADQEPVLAPIDLYTAMARAIKYNLDYRVEIMDEALKIKDLDLAHYDMLPKLVGSLNFNARDNESGSVSKSLLTGNTSLEPSTSNEREYFDGDLTMSWDVLDFGLSYVRAQQRGDQVLQAEENKRKVIQRIIEDVRSAYWRAASAQRLLGRARELEISTQGAIAQAHRQQRSRLSAPLPALSYERELLSIRRDLESLTRELNVAKQQLAALMNLPPDQDYQIVVPPRDLAWDDLNLSYNVMLKLAIQNRPELREVAYKLRSNEREGTAALLQALPNLKVFVGANWSDDDFLYHSDWASWGARASWNLLNVFSLPAQQDRIDAQGQLLDARALALTTAVATQVSVSRVRYELRRGELETAAQFLAVQDKIEGQVEAGYRADHVSEQTLIREQMNTLLAEVRMDQALADLQGAYGNVYTATGIDAVDADMSSDDSVSELASDLRRLWANRGDGLALAWGASS
ncbi:TolC family protein [Halomonas sp. V046]|uniref:TolC family protein n=1 Tax=Halomonas sp. V046 TaxID=3459611 RepID=UPI00404443D9